MNANVTSPASISLAANAAATASMTVKKTSPSSTDNNPKGFAPSSGTTTPRRFVVATTHTKNGRILVGVWTVGESKWANCSSWRNAADAMAAAMKLKETEGLWISRKSFAALSELLRQAKAANSAPAPAPEVRDEKSAHATAAPAGREPLTDAQADMFARGRRKTIEAKVAKVEAYVAIRRAALNAVKAVAARFDGKVLNCRFAKAVQEAIGENTAWVHLDSERVEGSRDLYISSRTSRDTIHYARIILGEGKRIDIAATVEGLAKGLADEEARLKAWRDFGDQFNTHAAAGVAAAEIIAEIIAEMPQHAEYDLRLKDAVWAAAEEILRSRRQKI